MVTLLLFLILLVLAPCLVYWLFACGAVVVTVAAIVALVAVFVPPEVLGYLVTIPAITLSVCFPVYLLALFGAVIRETIRDIRAGTFRITLSFDEAHKRGPTW